MGADEVRALLEDAGFSAVEVATVELTVVWTDVECAIAGILGTPFGPFVQALPSDRRGQLDADLRRRFGAPSPIRRTTTAVIARAAVPPRHLEKPWGHEIWYALTDRYAGKILHVNRGHRLSLQVHERKDESCYLLSGRLLLVQGRSSEAVTERTITAGGTWRNRPGDVHTIEAFEDCEVLEVSTPHLDDVVRLRDDYGRQDTTAP